MPGDPGNQPVILIIHYCCFFWWLGSAQLKKEIATSVTWIERTATLANGTKCFSNFMMMHVQNICQLVAQ